MVLGALLDAGLDFQLLKAELAKLALPSDAFRLTASRVGRAGFAATKVEVEVREPPRHRTLADVLAVIHASHFSQSDKERITRVFEALAAAEAKVHGTSVEAVELHEVGAVDAMVDVSGAVIALRLLGIERVFVSALPLGSGETRGSHGVIPVPAPATLELIAAAKAPTTASESAKGELVTPTGAAILTTLGVFERPAMTVERVGYGAGGRNPADRPNVLRAWVGEVETPPRSMRLVETNIDDMTPELLGHVQERLLAAGAADAWFTPIQMKKNRPAVMLSVLCRDELEDVVVRILLRETTTLGVRVRDVRRHEAERETVAFESSLGPVNVKVKRLADIRPAASPEYEDCRRIATERGLPLIEVFRTVEAEANAWLQRGESL
jgi:uncharacterized protein (TIGR00299 family) protein